jgi:hypothetical protein
VAWPLFRARDPRGLHLGGFQISIVLLAIPRLPSEWIREILDLCASSKASFKIIPGSYSYLDKRISAAMGWIDALTGSP